jgi:hypothetical protein
MAQGYVWEKVCFRQNFYVQKADILTAIKDSRWLQWRYRDLFIFWYHLADHFHILQAVLSTLIRNFSFELKGDPEIEMFKGVLPRPNIVGEDGPKIPLLVRRIK